MKKIFWGLLFFTTNSHAQKIKKADKETLAALQENIRFLSDDKLEGRRAGSNGEKLAGKYIIQAFIKNGLQPKGDDGGFLQKFDINEGKMISPSTHLIMNDIEFKLDKDYFPFSFSPNKSVQATAAIAMQENGSPWFYDIKELIEPHKNIPHFDLTESIKNKAIAAAKMGATAFIVYNTSPVKDELKFDANEKPVPVSIPVLYISKAAKEKYLADETATLDIKLKVQIEDKKRTGQNIIGYIDNNATSTIIIGAHYDHLGYGEEHTSLYTGSIPEIHNGADDNASGTAAIIELGKMLKKSKAKNNNYLLVAFSGEELGLFGSKYFTEHPTVNFSNANCMINIDMIGRLNDSTHKLIIGGYGTSPVWGEIIKINNKSFTIKFDSSGTGPSDHTSFYRKDIPVLYFFTGLHSDYHKPSDDADKINYTGELEVIKYIYNVIEILNKKGKLAFTKTREMPMGSTTSFKVTLGIMPDYAFSGLGVRTDGIIDGKGAQKAGLKAGDIIVQLGEYKTANLQAYMEALNKFNKGDATEVKVKRGQEEKIFTIIF